MLTRKIDFYSKKVTYILTLKLSLVLQTDAQHTHTLGLTGLQTTRSQVSAMHTHTVARGRLKMLLEDLMILTIMIAMRRPICAIMSQETGHSQLLLNCAASLSKRLSVNSDFV